MSSKAPGGVQPARKLVIKPFKVQPKLPENFNEETWEKLRSALHAVYHKNASSISKEELYRAVEALCMQKQASQTYDSLSKEIEGFIVQKVRVLHQHASLDPSSFLAQVDGVWQDHCEQIITIRNIFLYLDRSYALMGSGVRQILDLGHHFFRRELENTSYANGQAAASSSVPLVQRIVAAVVHRLAALRRGEMLNGEDSVLHGVCVNLCVTLQIYTTHLEPALLHDATQFFAREGAAEISSRDTASFLRLVDARLQEIVAWTAPLGTLSATSSTSSTSSTGLETPSSLCCGVLDGSSRRVLCRVVDQQLLAPHLVALLEGHGNGSASNGSSNSGSGGLSGLLDPNPLGPHNLVDLRRLGRLFARVTNGLELLKNAFAAYVRRVGEGLVNALLSSMITPSSATPQQPQQGAGAQGGAKSDGRFIEDVLEFLEKMDRVVREAFALATPANTASTANNTPPTAPTTTTASGATNSATAASNATAAASSTATVTSSEQLFRTALKVSAVHFLNLQAKVCAEQLARFCDKTLKGAHGLRGEEDAEQQLQQALSVFRYLQEPDVFEAFYKKLLAKRLLLEKSASSELERSMLSKLKAECGAAFTSKLEGMFLDLDLSAQCLTLFKQKYSTEYLPAAAQQLQLRDDNASSSSSPVPAYALREDQFTLSLLTQGHWPQPPPPSSSSSSSASNEDGHEDSAQTSNNNNFGLHLSAELLLTQRAFTVFYAAHYQGRRLRWTHSLSRCLVSMHLAGKGSAGASSTSSGKSSGSSNVIYELDVTLYQALVLKCFSASATALSIAQVSTKTGLSLEDARLALLSLATKQLRILTKATTTTSNTTEATAVASASAEAQQPALYVANATFFSKHRRVKVPMLNAVRDPNAPPGASSSQTVASSEEAERQQTMAEVFSERAYQCDAIIVRVMKARRTLAHAQLMAEVMQQMRFPAQNSDIKKRIEALIERDYLERDPNDNSVYRYLA